MVSAHDAPFAAAFGAWCETVDLDDIMTFEAAEGRDAVEIDFLVGDGALHGYAHPAGLSISASWVNEVYDLLWDDDLIADYGPDGWCCTLCSPTERAYFSTIEALWINHLFDPLRCWIDDQLRPAAMLEFHRRRGAAWAKLHRQWDQSSESNTPTCQVALSKDI